MVKLYNINWSLKWLVHLLRSQTVLLVNLIQKITMFIQDGTFFAPNNHKIKRCKQLNYLITFSSKKVYRYVHVPYFQESFISFGHHSTLLHTLYSVHPNNTASGLQKKVYSECKQNSQVASNRRCGASLLELLKV